MSTSSEIEPVRTPEEMQNAEVFLEAMWVKNGARVAHQIEMAAWELGDNTLVAMRQLSDEGRLLAIVKNDAKAPPNISFRTQPRLMPDGNIKIVRVADVTINTDFDHSRLVQEDAKLYVRGMMHNISPGVGERVVYGIEGLAILQQIVDETAADLTVPCRAMLLRIPKS